MDKEVYLGDGLYASFDGYQIKLRAPRAPMITTDHEVFLDPRTLANLIEYANKIKGEWQ